MNVDARNVTPNKVLMNSKMDKLSDMRSKAILGAVLMLFGGTSFMSYWFAQAVPLLVFGILLFLEIKIQGAACFVPDFSKISAERIKST